METLWGVCVRKEKEFFMKNINLIPEFSKKKKCTKNIKSFKKYFVISFNYSPIYSAMPPSSALLSGGGNGEQLAAISPAYSHSSLSSSQYYAGPSSNNNNGGF